MCELALPHKTETNNFQFFCRAIYFYMQPKSCTSLNICLKLLNCFAVRGLSWNRLVFQFQYTLLKDKIIATKMPSQIIFFSYIFRDIIHRAS